MDPVARSLRHQIDMFLLDNVGWHEIDDVSERPQQHSVFQTVLIDFQPASFLPRIRDQSGPVRDHFDRQNHSALANLPHVAMRLQIGDCGTHVGRGCAVFLHNGAVIEQIKAELDARMEGVEKALARRMFDSHLVIALVVAARIPF